MKIIVQSDEGDIERGIIRVEDFDFSDISSRYALMNEVRDAIMSVKQSISERGNEDGVKG